MNLNDYQSQAMSFRQPSADEAYAVLNLAGEVGEFMSHAAKALRDGEPEDLTRTLIKELGDILWCITAIADDLGSSLDDVASTNIGKLSSRKDRGTLQGSGDNR